MSPQVITRELEAQFEQAVEAVINGDVVTLQSLLANTPALATAQSSRAHHATLLFYVAANGVEGERQKTPANILDITKLLLQAGTDPNANADMYGGSSVLVALVSSVHPARAGKQADLVKLLCDYGANPNGPEDDGMPLATAIAFRYREAIHALADCGARMDNVVFAAALGDLERVKQLAENEIAPFTDAFRRKLETPAEVMELALTAASMTGYLDVVRFLLEHGVNIDAPRSAEKGTALHEACHIGQLAVARYLLEQGANTALQDKQGITPLHWAAWYAHLDLVDLLLSCHAPLEVKNMYGGTVLSAAIYNFTQRKTVTAQQLSVLKTLLDAGADVQAVTYPTGSGEIDDLLKSYLL